MFWCRCHRLAHFGNRLLATRPSGRWLPAVNTTNYGRLQLPIQHLITSSCFHQSTKDDPGDEGQKERRRDQSTESETDNPDPGNEEGSRERQRQSTDDLGQNDDGKKERRSRQTTSLVRQDLFDSLGNKSKDTFLMAVDVFNHRDKHARGHVEFIRSALKHMKAFGVHRDAEAYKKLIDVFPKGKFIATNLWQQEFMHFPKQQHCAIEVLEQMENMGVMPDSELEEMLMIVFGDNAHPLRKFRRMAYWMPKFRNLSPWPIPENFPEQGMDIARLAIERITSVDPESKVTTFYPLEELDDSIDPTWIVSGQSVTQQRLIDEHPATSPIYVEGAFRIWLRRACINYFILRTEPKPVIKSTRDEDDVSLIPSLFAEDYVANVVANIPSTHEQEDGIILAVCATGTSSLDSILSWIRYLERTNPRLGKDISVLFTLKSPIGPTDDLQPVPVTSDQVPVDSMLKEGVTRNQLVIAGPSSSRSSGVEKYRRGKLFKHRLTFDPGNPQLSQVGVEEGSDTRFVNWPHHHNSAGKQRRNQEGESADDDGVEGDPNRSN